MTFDKVSLSTTVDPDIADAVERLAEKEGVNKSEMLRRLIDRGLCVIDRGVNAPNPQPATEPIVQDVVESLRTLYVGEYLTTTDNQFRLFLRSVGENGRVLTLESKDGTLSDVDTDFLWSLITNNTWKICE